jgi:hypothetical protein
MNSVSNVDDLLQQFRATSDLETLEQLADRLGESGDRRAVTTLLYRLGDLPVQEDRDVEDAVCDALVRFGVMRKLGNLTFEFNPPETLPEEVRQWLDSHRLIVPRKYFGSQ